MQINVLIVGGGMITQEVVLPTVLQMRNAGRVGHVLLATRRAKTVRAVQELFPESGMQYWPDPNTTDPEASHPDLYKEAIRALPRPGAVIVATPDHLHTPVILAALESGFDVIVEKPLCMQVEEAHMIADIATRKGLYVYTDFHKRHDKALRACQYKYRRGQMGEALCSHAWIEERREMPLHYFALWAEHSNSFDYIGCHYVDVFHFVTGELPRKVVGFGQRKFLVKNGKNTYDAVQAVIEWESGAVQYVQTSWILPEGNPNLTNQGFQITCTEGEFRADNADRNSNFVTTSGGYERYNPHFLKSHLDWDSPENDFWEGYGGDSIIQPIEDIRRLHQETDSLSAEQALRVRRRCLERLESVRPLPGQALIATAVMEAVRLSLSAGSQPVEFGDGLRPRLA